MSFAKIMKQSLDGLIIYQTLQAFYFSQFFDYLKENNIEWPSEFFNFIPTDLV